MKKQVTWTLGNGTVATYTIELQLAKEINLDGDKSIVPCCNINKRLDIPGMGYLSAEILNKSGRTANGVDYVAVIGGKVAIVADVYAQIKTAITDVENAPEWVAKQATIKRNDADAKALYARRIKNGMCPKCHSYCCGDCGAN